MEPQVEVVK